MMKTPTEAKTVKARTMNGAKRRSILAPIKVERDNYQSSSIFPRRDSMPAIG
jgi:hypothetical protein